MSSRTDKVETVLSNQGDNYDLRNAIINALKADNSAVNDLIRVERVYSQKLPPRQTSPFQLMQMYDLTPAASPDAVVTPQELSTHIATARQLVQDLSSDTAADRPLPQMNEQRKEAAIAFLKVVDEAYLKHNRTASRGPAASRA